MVRCCVPTCNNTNKAILHRFPYTDEEVYNIWLARIGIAKLYTLDPKKVYKNIRICHKHFSDYSKITSGYYSKTGLKKRSLPTINLPGFKEEPSEENSRLKYERKISLEPSMLSMYIY